MPKVTAAKLVEQVSRLNLLGGPVMVTGTIGGNFVTRKSVTETF